MLSMNPHALKLLSMKPHVDAVGFQAFNGEAC
jgi:hypothetical protein